MAEEGKIYYSMTEAQEMTGLPASTLRYWERHFTQLDPRSEVPPLAALGRDDKRESQIRSEVLRLGLRPRSG